MSKKICKIRGCHREVFCKGFCQRHYMQVRNGIRNAKGVIIRKLYNVRYINCKVCDKVIGNSGGSKKLGFCSTHNWQYRNNKIDIKGRKV